MSSFENYPNCVLFLYKYGRLIVPGGNFPQDWKARRTMALKLERVFAKVSKPFVTGTPVHLPVAMLGTGWVDSDGKPWTYLRVDTIRNDEGLAELHDILLRGVSGRRPDLRIVIDLQLLHEE